MEMSTDNPHDYEVHNPRIQKVLQKLGRWIKDVLPPGWGFTLLLFEFNKESLFYISNANRDDMIATMKEFIAKQQRN